MPPITIGAPSIKYKVPNEVIPDHSKKNVVSNTSRSPPYVAKIKKKSITGGVIIPSIFIFFLSLRNVHKPINGINI